MTLQRQDRLRSRIQRSRARLMVDNPEFALVLMYMRYVATKQVYRISTNGKIVYFDPDWLQKLTGDEMDYTLSHQVLHIVRDDVKRPAFFAGDRYHHACDIIINSFMRELGLGVEKYQHIGELPHTTYYPIFEGSVLTPIEAFHAVPFDPARMKPGQRRALRIDSDEWWGRYMMPEDGILILYPGFKGLSDEVIREVEESGPIINPKYQMFFSQSLPADGEPVEMNPDEPAMAFTGRESIPNDEPQIPQDIPERVPEQAEDEDDADMEDLDVAIDRLVHMIESMESASAKHTEVMDRIIKGVAGAKLEWRKLLNTFLQEEIHDYSFLPPDRRFNDSGFFLPDFNERDDEIQNVLFMVDTSGSVDDQMLSLVYGEISAAIEQFNGRLFGMLGFFNTDVMPPIPFCTIRELLRIRPKGYGGTDFGCVFRYIEDHPELTPSCIVVFTDGEGLYPPVEAAMGIPVLWILHGDADFPRWGCTARLI